MTRSPGRWPAGGLDLRIESKLPTWRRYFGFLQGELPQSSDVNRIGDDRAGFLGRKMFGHDHVLAANHDLVLALSDEDRLAGILGRE